MEEFEMEKGINLQIEEYKARLVSVINEANLPISLTALVLQNLLAETTMVAQQLVAKEKQEFDSANDKCEVNTTNKK
jgi:hypothetical protein